MQDIVAGQYKLLYEWECRVAFQIDPKLPLFAREFVEPSPFLAGVIFFVRNFHTLSCARADLGSALRELELQT